MLFLIIATLFTGVLIFLYYSQVFGIVSWVLSSALSVLLFIISKPSLPRINLPKIEDVLRKAVKEPDFFRKEPYWVDFEKGYLVERKEVGEIIKKLERNPRQLVVGESASGKSVIVKNVGYKLRKGGCRVFILELKWDEIDINEILKIVDQKKTLLVIDDSHLDFLQCNRLLRRFASSKIKILVSTQEVIERKSGPKEETEIEVLESNKGTCTRIRAIDISDEVVANFMRTKYGYQEIGDNERVLSQKYGHDLWMLSWALAVYDPKVGAVEEKRIYEKIKEMLIKGEYAKANADDILLPLSVFYSHGVPIERKFLSQTLNLDNANITELIDYGLIKERDKLISLQHSSVAKIYLETFRNYDFLAKDVKEELQERFGDWHLGLFHLYFQSNPSNCCDTLRDLHLWRTDIPDKLMENKETKEAVIKGIKKEKNIEKAASCLDFFYEKKEILESLSIPDLIAKLNTLIYEDPLLMSVSNCIVDFSLASNEFAKKLAEGLNVTTLRAKLNELEFPFYVGFCVWGVSQGSEKVGRLLTEGLNIDSLRKKLEKEKSISAIGGCLATLSRADKKFTKELAESLNIVSLRTKVENEHSVVNIRDFLEGAKQTSGKVAKELVESLDLNNLISKFNKEDILPAFATSLLQMCDVSKKVAEKLVEGLDLATVKTRLEKKGDVRDIDYCLLAIFNGNKEVGKKFIRSFDIANLKAKLENEEDIEVYDSCVFTIFFIDKELAYELVNSMDTKRLKAKVDKEQNQEKIARLALHVYLIYKANGESALNKVFDELLDPLLCFLDMEKKERYEEFYKSLIINVSKYMLNLLKQERLPETHFLFPERYDEKLLIEVSKVDEEVKEAILSLTDLSSEAIQIASYFMD